jgi:hypothetical protein
LKRIVGLVVALAMVLGAAAGCDPTPAEPVYTDVSVGPLTASIPDDWERPEGYDDIMAAFLGSAGGWTEGDVYEDSSGNALVFLEVIDMVGYYELQDWVWQGWDAELAAADVTREDYAGLIGENLLAGSMEITQQTHQQLTICGYESWESTFIASYEDETKHICLTAVFAPEDAGVLFMVIEESKWTQFEDIWTAIRDSITI